MAGATRNLTDWAQPSAMLSKRASPEDATRSELTMDRSGATQTRTMATSPGVNRRTTMKDTGSPSNGASGVGGEGRLIGRAHPLRVLMQTAMKTAVRIDLSRQVSVRPAVPGLT